MDTTTPAGAAVAAEGFGLKGPRGWVFRDVTFSAPPGSLVAIEGPSGSGRTCLLLALTGRMHATAGHAVVAGIRLPKHLAAVRKVAALGPVDGVAELEAALTISEHLRERALLQRRFEGPLRALLRPKRERVAEAQDRIDHALSAAGLDLEALPKGPRTYVRDLERLEALRLGVALALLGQPKLLAVDDADHKLSSADRDAAWSMLRTIADAGTTVLATCTEAPPGAITIPLGPLATGADSGADAGTGTGTDAGAGAGEGERGKHGKHGKHGEGRKRGTRREPASSDTTTTDNQDHTSDESKSSEGAADAYAEARGA